MIRRASVCGRSKDDVEHVQPPAEVLSRMLTLRLPLDTCDESGSCSKSHTTAHDYRAAIGRIDLAGVELPVAEKEV
ncbi:MAG: hypothetical protein JWN98_360 [Abditibacteriota bacterium]|nr:hypothetical protein [Abditibacteriota bacterium]